MQSKNKFIKLKNELIINFFSQLIILSSKYYAMFNRKEKQKKFLFKKVNIFSSLKTRFIINYINSF